MIPYYYYYNTRFGKTIFFDSKEGDRVKDAMGAFDAFLHVRARCDAMGWVCFVCRDVGVYLVV